MWNLSQFSKNHQLAWDKNWINAEAYKPIVQRIERVVLLTKIEEKWKKPLNCYHCHYTIVWIKWCFFSRLNWHLNGEMNNLMIVVCCLIVSEPSFAIISWAYLMKKTHSADACISIDDRPLHFDFHMAGSRNQKKKLHAAHMYLSTGRFSKST